MDYSKIGNPAVRAALEAWQNGDSKTFVSYFIADPILIDDDKPRDFKEFISSACGKEKFLEIDNVTNDGQNIYGKFDAGPGELSGFTLNFIPVRRESLKGWTSARHNK